ncbi:MAG: fibronectin type III domain-containing protein [Thermoanaerobacteraceae bacterium]
MKRFLSLFVVFAMAISFLSSPVNLLAAEPVYKLGATQKPDHVILTWQDDPYTTQTISWRTDISTNKSIVQYVKETDSLSFPKNSLSQEGNVEKFVSDLGEMNLHTVTIKNLEPGTKYIYRVGDGTNWSNTYSFKTEPKNITSFKFLVFGDSQSGLPTNPEYGPWEKTVQNAFKANPDSKFFVNVGDLVEWGQYYAHWNNWFSAAEGVVDTIPAMAVEGNHETYNPPDWHTTKPIFFTSQFKLPQNGPQNLKGQTYSFDYGNAHIVMLNSQEEEEKNINGSILEDQKKWLENDLKNTDKTWKIVFFHKTPYYNKATRTNEDIKKAFTPIFDKYHVDIVFNGHDHGISRTYPINNDKFVDNPSKGTIYYVTGRSGNKYYYDLSSKVWDAFFYDPQDQPNYIVVKIDKDKMNIEAVKQDGTLIDSYTIDKLNGTDYPKTILPPKYNETKLVVFGNMLQQPLMPTSPKKINNKWYIPVRAFIQYLGGNVDWNNNGKIRILYGKNEVNISIESDLAAKNKTNINLPDKVYLDKNITFISSDDLNKLFDFTYKYDESTNMLMFTK